MDVVVSRNAVYQTAYHMVWCPKYRRRALVGEVADSLRSLIDGVCRRHGWPLISLEVQPDHVHLFISLPPSASIAGAVKILKGNTARKLLMQFPGLRGVFRKGHLWSPSYYVGTAGAMSAEAIQRYIERCGHVTERR